MTGSAEVPPSATAPLLAPGVAGDVATLVGGPAAVVVPYCPGAMVVPAESMAVPVL